MPSKLAPANSAVKRIIADLEGSGYLSRERQGRRNHCTWYGEADHSGPMTRGLPGGCLPLSALLP
ncbi:MAG: hypothetical protein IPF51_16245 [Dehalococcoidia bacterium]|uniref:hypothetical protein n=1 Tax=Candidatus Amarobacter glycogenicus TaxID=3140699 RepID=UPI0031361636|nr:hypothetical protein [Dehalococcoidia bacterium]